MQHTLYLIILLIPAHFLCAQNLLASETRGFEKPVDHAALSESVASAVEMRPPDSKLVTVKAPAIKILTSKGTAMWVENPLEENINNFYALHRYAPIGTSIQMVNPMNGLTVDVKVVGRLPAISIYNNIVAVVSAATARELHILDQKFIVVMKRSKLASTR